jgi:hypothetical protein
MMAMMPRFCKICIVARIRDVKHKFCYLQILTLWNQILRIIYNARSET